MVGIALFLNLVEDFCLHHLVVIRTFPLEVRERVTLLRFG